MAPVPKKVIGVCATTKIARKARPSHHKGVSFRLVEREASVVICMELLLWWCRQFLRLLMFGALAKKMGRRPVGSGLLWDTPVDGWSVLSML